MTLSWAGKDLTPFRPTLPQRVAAARATRSWRAPDGVSTLLRADNLECLQALAATHSGAFTLAYLDPPFFTNRQHLAVVRAPGRLGRAQPTRVRAFDDRWPDLPSWLQALGERLCVTRDLLAAHGSVVVHVDPKTSHYARVLGDEIFGTDAFASEIVWRYRRWPSKTPNFQRVHDVLLRWRKSPLEKPRWNQPYEPLAASTLATWGTKKQRAVFSCDGRRTRSMSSSVRTEGVAMGDVWEIGVIAPLARERTGYPSQKPEALLERLIAALSNPGDLVLDPYAGSGTALAVAYRMRRRFVGIDASPVAIATVRNRFEALGASLIESRASGRLSLAHPKEIHRAEMRKRPVAGRR